MNDFSGFGITLALAIGAAVVVFASSVGVPLPRACGLTQHRADAIFSLLALVYFVLFSTLAVLRFLSFTTGDIYINASFDLGHYDQILWNSLRGRLFENSFIPDAPNFLGKTFTPLLLAFIPLYAIWSDPIVLLIVQTLALTVAGFPIYWFARQRLPRIAALAIAAAYFLSPAVQSVNINEFHEIALAAPILAFLMFFLLRGHQRGMLACLVLALMLKEELALVTIALGLFIALFRKNVRWGVALAGFGAVWAFAVLQWVIPFFQTGEAGSSFYYFGRGVVAGGAARYAYLGRSLPEVVLTILTQPQIVLANVVLPEKMAYVLHLLVPLVFLPMVGAEFLLLTLPTFGYTLLSTFPPQYSIHFSYSPPLIPFLFFGAIAGWARLARWIDTASRHVPMQNALVAALAVASLGNYIGFAPGPFGQYFQAERYRINPHTWRGNVLLRGVPMEAVVITQWDLLAHLSNRRYVYEVPRISHYLQADYMVVDTTSGWYDVHKGMWESYLASGYFEIEKLEDGWLIARRKLPETLLNARVNNQITLVGSTLNSQRIRGGALIEPIVYWRAESPIAERWKFSAQVTDAQGHIWAEVEQEPQEGLMPTTQWQVGKLIGDQYALRLPPTMPMGDYWISVHAQRIAADALSPDNEATIATVRVAKNKESFTASQIEIPERLSVDMQEMRFLGFVPPRATIRGGELLRVGVYWRAREKPRGDYVVAVQLRDSTGRVAAEEANRPANGTYPTPQWDAGEVLLDWHDFDLPREMPSGAYELWVLLREAVSGRVIGETTFASMRVVR